MPVKFQAPSALLPKGWAEDVVFEVDDGGSLASVTPGGGAKGCELLKGPVIPGMPNLHSHAFQRAMAGLAEQRGEGRDSFWSWRDVMYRFVALLTPRQIEAIAAQLYVEMLKSGYTAVGEFHYLHHGPDGRPYGDPAETSRRIVGAAERSGIGLTLLPVLYAHSDFGGAAPKEGQRRFLHDAEAFARLLEALHPDFEGRGDRRLGIAPHSLRAVTPEELGRARAALDALDPGAPVHIHVAEQTGEVEACLAWSGKRPVAWLLENQPVDARWCLVHATHMTAEETTGLADSGAVAGLCPTTEANLGDGIFPGIAYLGEGGHFGIGSDSHISVDPWEELRWLEYGQRLAYMSRNLLVSGASPNVGAGLLQGALNGGAQALGRPIGRLSVGARADFLVLDAEAPALWGKAGAGLLDALIFAGGARAVRDVYVGGHRVVSEGRHEAEEAVFADYKSALSALMARL
jgi:formimidoylglutamate deiminase